MINLENYVDKKVIIKFQGPEIYYGILRKEEDPIVNTLPYRFRYEPGNNSVYLSQDGYAYSDRTRSVWDIEWIEIDPKNYNVFTNGSYQIKVLPYYMIEDIDLDGKSFNHIETMIGKLQHYMNEGWTQCYTQIVDSPNGGEIVEYVLRRRTPEYIKAQEILSTLNVEEQNALYTQLQERFNGPQNTLRTD